MNPHLQTRPPIRIRIFGPAPPGRGRRRGARRVAGPHVLVADAAVRGAGGRLLLGGEAAAEEEVEGAHDGGVGADDADVDFGSECGGGKEGLV